MVRRLVAAILDSITLRGVLTRLTLIYALGSLLLSALIAFATFSITQNRLLSEFQTDALRQFADNLAETRISLTALDETGDPETTGSILSALDDKLRHTDFSDSLLVLEGVGMRLTNRNDREIPDQLTQQLETSEAAAMFYEFDGEKRFIAGARVAQAVGDQDAIYHEIHSLTELDGTLGQLRSILVGAAIFSALAGAALGYYAGKKSLAPIGRISQAAKQIADGNYKTRLDLQADPDLAVLGESFNNMVNELQAKAERDQRFTSDVSHELRSPLMTLTASLELLERRSDELPVQAQQAVGLIGEDIGRFQALVEDLLEISRLDAGAEQIAWEPIVVSEFLARILDSPKYNGVELSFSEQDDDLIIFADKRRLLQTITNLLSNADKYAGGATDASFRQIGDFVHISIADLGPGVDLSERETIFDRFSRGAQHAGNRQSGSGVGLGLSLVSEHVGMHGGRVWVADRTDGNPGARFIIELPINSQKDQDTELSS